MSAVPAQAIRAPVVPGGARPRRSPRCAAGVTVVQTHQQFLLDDSAEELTEAESINYHQARQPKKTVLPPEDGDIDFLGEYGEPNALRLALEPFMAEDLLEMLEDDVFLAAPPTASPNRHRPPSLCRLTSPLRSNFLSSPPPCRLTSPDTSPSWTWPHRNRHRPPRPCRSTSLLRRNLVSPSICPLADTEWQMNWSFKLRVHQLGI